MNLHDHIVIETSLNNGDSFKTIGSILGKGCTTISKEVRKNSVQRNISAVDRIFNNCQLYRLVADTFVFFDILIMLSFLITASSAASFFFFVCCSRFPSFNIGDFYHLQRFSQIRLICRDSQIS